MPVVLSPYPLSRPERNFFEELLGDGVSYQAVAELRRLPVPEMLRSLREAGPDRCFLALPDATGGPLRPLLHSITAAAGFRHVEAVGPDGQRQSLRRWTVPISAGAVAAATLSNASAVRSSRRQLSGLRQTDRAELPLGANPRVLYLNTNLWLGLQVGGSVGHTVGVANALTAAGHPVDLAAITMPPGLNASVRPAPLIPPATLGVPFESNSYRFGRAIIRQLRPSLSISTRRFIYQRLSVANYSGVALSRATRTPLVLEYNGSEVWTAKHWGTPLRYHDLAAAAEEVSLRHAHVVVTVSKVLREELVERGVASERIAYYPNCVDPDLFDSGRFGPGERLTRRRELGIRDDAVVVTFVGTFGRWHGVDVLARAIQRLIVGDPDWLAFNKVQFLLIGDGLLGNEVNATLSSAARAPEFVIRTGIVPQQRTPELLMISDVVLSPHVPNPDGSRFFGSPTKLFEYMAAGKAIVASDLEQIGEVLHPSLDAGRLPEGGPGARATELAVLVQPADVEQLICALRFLVGHPEWRRRLGANARSRAVERYTWKDHVATILSRVHAVIPE